MSKYGVVREIVNDLLEDIEINEGRKGVPISQEGIIKLLIIGLGQGISDTPEPKWTVMFDAGKPYEEHYDSDEALEKGLREFYEQHKDSGDSFDAKVYNAEGDDFTETQFIEEMMVEIMGDENE